MPIKARTAVDALEAYLEELKGRNRLQRTVDNYRTSIRRTWARSTSLGLEISPSKVSRKEITALMGDMEKTLRPHSVQQEMTIYGAFLEWAENPVIRKMKIRWRITARIHVRWLEEDQARAMFMAAETPSERVMVAFMLGSALRSAEVCDFKMTDLGPTTISFMGKGRKERTVPYFPGAEVIIREWLQVRAEMVKQYRSTHPEWQDHGYLLMTPQGMMRMATSTVLKAIKRVGARAGIPNIGCHDLRRTAGRLMWKAGVALEVIRDILGHESLDMTIRYLGINLEDRFHALATYAGYLGMPSRPSGAEMTSIQRLRAR